MPNDPYLYNLLFAIGTKILIRILHLTYSMLWHVLGNFDLIDGTWILCKEIRP